MASMAEPSSPPRPRRLAVVNQDVEDVEDEEGW